MISSFYEKFYIFIKSSFAEKEKKDLYDFIWKNYGRRITYYIGHFVPAGHYCSDDLYQEVMLKIYNNLHTFNPLHSFKAWIYQIARCQCLDFIKSKEEKCQVLRQGEPDRIGDDSDPEKEALRDELFLRIDRFIAVQDPLDREICYLRFYEDLSYREISRIVGVNLNSLKSRLHQVKVKLKAHLAGRQL